MKSKSDEKIVIIISVISIIGTIIFGFIYSKNTRKPNTVNSFNEYFHNYKVNEIQRLYLSTAEISSKYLANLVSDILYNPRDVYNNLDNETRDKYSTYSDFEKMITDRKSVV